MADYVHLKKIFLGTRYHAVFKKKFVFEKWLLQSEPNRISKVVEAIKRSINCEEKENLNFEKLDQKVKYICKKTSTSWRKNHYIRHKFLESNNDWLQTEERIVIDKDKDDKVCELKCRRGRPRKNFNESSKRTQKRRMAAIAKKDQSFVAAFRHGIIKKNNLKRFKVEEVLSLLVEAQLTKHQYLLIKNFVNTKISSNIFPSYHNVLKEKKNAVIQRQIKLKLPNLLLRLNCKHCLIIQPKE